MSHPSSGIQMTASSDAEASNKKVSFSFPVTETDLGESARLLQQQAFTPFSQGGSNLTEFQHQPGTPDSARAMVPPRPSTMMTPVDLEEAPTEDDAWPKATMRIACTHCGHYIETTMKEETEYMGYRSCFSSSKPVFRRSFVHYCPNCSEAIGYHYPGEDCFCNHEKSTMTFDSVLMATCCAWGTE